MAPPVNDNFASAIALSTTLPGTRTGDTTVDATYETGEPLPWFGTVSNQSVWYTFTPTHTGIYRFYIHNTGTVVWSDIRRYNISLYSGSTVGGLTLITQARDNNTGPSVGHAAIRATLTSGVTYRIMISSPRYSGDPSNAHTIIFDLDWDEIDSSGLPPANDDIANAEDLGTDPVGIFSGSNQYATWETWEEANGYNQPSVWYKFSVGFTGTQTVSLTKTGADPDWQPYAEIYKVTSDPPSDFTDLSFFNYLGDTVQTSTLASTDIAFVPGDYYLVVYNWNFDQSWDDFDLEFGGAPASPPANNNFANRIVLPSHYAETIAGTTAGATTEGSEPNTNPGSHNPPYPSIWFEYVAPNFNNTPLSFQLDTEGSSAADTYLEIFTGSSIAGLTLIASDHNSGAGGKSKITTNLTGNTNYKIRVSSAPGSEGGITLNINAKPAGSAPGNDNFANATLMTGYSDSESGTLVAATGEYDDKSGTFSDVSTNSVWYKWVPPQTGRVLLTFTAGSSNPYLSIWRGTTLAGLVRVQDISISNGSFPWAFQAEGGVTYYFKVEGSGGYQGTFSFSFEMANVSPPANDDPANAQIISPVSGVVNLTIPTLGALWDSVGPRIGDFVTDADEDATVWYKFTTGADKAGSLNLHFISQTTVNGLSNGGIASIYQGSDIATAVSKGNISVGGAIEIALNKNETYWISLSDYYWSTDVNVEATLQFKSNLGTGGSTADPGNGTSDFDSISGGFTADAIDGEFVASGGVGYGRIQPWTSEGHYPYGWWCRFDLNSTSGDYLYRYGQTEQYIEFFRATKAGGDYHSLYLVGSRDGTQSISAGINGSIDFATNHRVFGLSKFGTSEKVRIEIGENGITIDGYCFVHDSHFSDVQADQFDQFDFGILSYPGNGSAYVDLDPEWNLRFSNIRIHDDPEECVMGTPVEGVKEVSLIAGWTQGYDYYKPNSNSFRQLGPANLATVVPSAGEYDGFSLDCTVTSPSATQAKGYGWNAGNSQPGVNIYYNPYTGPANDTYFPGFSFRFWIDTMPSQDLCIGFIGGGSSLGGDQNGCLLYLRTNGVLAIRPSIFSDLIDFCHTEIDKWNYIELQQDLSSRKYATKIWLDNVYMGRFETTSVPTATNTGVPNRPPQWSQYAIGRLGSVASPFGGFSAITVGIQFRDIAITRRKVDRPLGPTIVVPMPIQADGTHNYPDPDTYEPGVPDEGFNSDFSLGTDGAGQPHYWTGYDRHDTGRPAGAMYLGYLFRQFPDGLVSLTTDGSGPPGHTAENAMRIEAVGSGAGAAYVFGGATEPAIDLVYNYNYADTMSAQFWMKGVAGKTVRLKANTGIGDLDEFNAHTLVGGWEHVKLWLTPNSVTGTIQLQDVWLDFPDAVLGDVFLVKDFHLYLNPLNNPPHFWESSDGGASGVVVPFDATNTWSYLDDMPPDANATQIYTNTRNFLNRVRGREDDGKTHLPPLWSDHYLEWRFSDQDASENPQVFAAKMIVSIKGYNGEGNTSDAPPDLDGYVQGGYVILTIANDDGAIRYIGKHAAHILLSDPDQTFYGLPLSRPPGNGEWNLTAWNETRLRLMSHDKTFSNSLVIVGDFNGAGLIEGAVAEILTYDRRLTPPSCKQLIAVYSTSELT
jgi:hypothetical protein